MTPPPTTPRPLRFDDAVEKSRYIDFWARVHAFSEPIARLVEASGWLSLPPPQRAALIHAYVRDRIVYTRDPARREQLADAAVVLGRGLDDCDGKAGAFVSLAIASGLEARIRPVFQGGAFVHVQAEVRYPGSERHPLADVDGWLLAELTLAGVPLGAGTESARRGPGRRIIYA